MHDEKPTKEPRRFCTVAWLIKSLGKMDQLAKHIFFIFIISMNKL